MTETVEQQVLQVIGGGSTWEVVSHVLARAIDALEQRVPAQASQIPACCDDGVSNYDPNCATCGGGASEPVCGELRQDVRNMLGVLSRYLADTPENAYVRAMAIQGLEAELTRLPSDADRARELERELRLERSEVERLSQEVERLKGKANFLELELGTQRNLYAGMIKRAEAAEAKLAAVAEAVKVDSSSTAKRVLEILNAPAPQPPACDSSKSINTVGIDSCDCGKLRELLSDLLSWIPRHRESGVAVNGEAVYRVGFIPADTIESIRADLAALAGGAE